MVILPLYQAVFAVAQGKFSKARFFSLTHDGRTGRLRMPELAFPSFHPALNAVCGIFRNGENEKDFIASAPFKTADDHSCDLMFTLSKRRMAYPVLSPDAQKAAFIEYENNGENPVLRLISREEYGWFPLQIRIPASFAPVCWGGNETVLFSDEKGALCAVTTAGKHKAAVIDPCGKTPAFHEKTRRLAFAQNGEIIIKGDVSAALEAKNVTALNFSRNGDALFFAAGKTLNRFSFEEQETVRLCETDAPAVWVSEL